MTPTNGSHPTAEAIAQAEADALAHQDAHPPVTPPPAAEKPAEPALYSDAWYDIQERALDADQQQKYALWQQAIGRLDAIRQLRALSARTRDARP